MSFNLSDSDINALLQVYHSTPRLSALEFETADQEFETLIREKHPPQGIKPQPFPKSKEKRLFLLAMKVNQFDAWRRSQTAQPEQQYIRPRQLQLL